MSTIINTARRPRWDIFCRVIDNFGDIAVSWRLARQLAAEHGIAVRLWVDQLDALHALCPTVNAGAARQVADGVEIFSCDEAALALLSAAPPGDAVIEAFGCGLPPRYVAAMAAREAKPCWIILEYLSAESWVRDHHGLPSPHPQLNLPRHFFFPGFDAGGGGLLCEADLLTRRAAFDGAARARWWQGHGFGAVPDTTLAVSLFGYVHAPVVELIEACAAGATPVVMAVPEGALASRVRERLGVGMGTRTAERGRAVPAARLGNLEVRFMPFLPQTDYDHLLWACDINFVRGEDSFVRAQWAAQPLIWHIYPQSKDAHRVKLDAFLDRYTTVLDADAAGALRQLWHAWNGVAGAPPLTAAWAAFCAVLGRQRRGLEQWRNLLRHNGDLAGNLLKFCAKMI